MCKRILMVKRLNRNLVHFPYNVGKLPFFYGWVVLVAGTAGVVMSAPGQTIGVSVFTDKLIQALDVSRTDLSLSYMLGTGLSAVAMTFAGIFYDRLGARFMASISAVFLSIVLIIFSQIDCIVRWIEKTIQNESVLITIITVTMAFFFLRLFGQGVLTLVSRNMVMKWFDRYRGLANGILGVIISFGFSYAPRLFNDLIEASGWRMAWINIALGLILFALLAFILFRDDPYECSQEPDGFNINLFKKNNPSPPIANKDFTLRETVQTYSFWMFNLGLFLAGLHVTAFTFHVVSIFDTSGLDRETAISIFLPAAIISVLFHFGGSWSSDFIRLKYLLLVLLGALITSMISILYLYNPLFYKLLILANGAATGMFGTLIAVTWPKLYGTKHLGAISGFSMGWVVAGSAVGPFLLSLSYQYNDNYKTSIFVLIGITLLLFILSLFSKK